MFLHLGILWGFCFECIPQPRERHDCNQAAGKPNRADNRSRCTRSTNLRSFRPGQTSLCTLTAHHTTATAHTMSAMSQAEVPAGGARANFVDWHDAALATRLSPFLSPLCLGSPRAARQSDSECGANNAHTATQ